ncbi:MAG: 7-carboxy-7-deazaguanine synthase, partial [Aquificaceae bacterium]
ELKFVVDQELNSGVILQFREFLQKGVVVLQPEGNKEAFLQKALDIQLSLMGMGYQVRVVPQVHKLLGLK